VYGSGNSKFQALGVRGVSGDGGGPDLPTSKTCKSEDFEKKAQKNLEIRTSNLEISKICVK